MPAMTWWGMWKAAEAKAGISTTSVPGNNAQSALQGLSILQNELHSFTNSVHRNLMITVAVASSDGGFVLDVDMKHPVTLAYLPTGGLQDIDVSVVPPEIMAGYKRQLAPVGLGAYQQQYIFTVDQGKLWLYPYVGVTGTLTLRYVPNLIPYDPSNPTGEWVTATANPTAFMQANGPEILLTTGLTGMIDAFAADLMEKAGTTKTFADRYVRYLQNWEKAKAMTVRDTPKLNKRMIPPHSNGILR